MLQALISFSAFSGDLHLLTYSSRDFLRVTSWNRQLPICNLFGRLLLLICRMAIRCDRRFVGPPICGIVDFWLPMRPGPSIADKLCVVDLEWPIADINDCWLQVCSDLPWFSFRNLRFAGSGIKLKHFVCFHVFKDNFQLALTFDSGVHLGSSIYHWKDNFEHSPLDGVWFSFEFVYGLEDTSKLLCSFPSLYNENSLFRRWQLLANWLTLHSSHNFNLREWSFSDTWHSLNSLYWLCLYSFSPFNDYWIIPTAFIFPWSLGPLYSFRQIWSANVMCLLIWTS